MDFCFENDFIKFTQKMMEELTKGNEENVFVSPFSIFVLMALLGAATDGGAQEEIKTLICSKEDKTDAFLNDLKVFERSLSSVDFVKFNSANALAVCDIYADAIKDGFKKTMKSCFDAEIFSDSNIVDKINKWVSRKTNGMIENVMQASSNVDFALINVASFFAEWNKAYEDDDICGNQIFRNRKRQKRLVTMLGSNEDYGVRADDFSGFIRPYKGLEYDFVALLPKDEKKKMEEFVSGGIVAKLPEIYRNAESLDVRAWIPEFEFHTSYELKETLEKLGVRKAFDIAAADFSPVMDIPNTYCDSIIHKAYVKVDRKGTKAAAVTMGVCAAGCAPDFNDILVVELNRPFLFAIMHRQTSTPVFVGVVNDIGEKI